MFVLINPASSDPRNNCYPLGLAYIAQAMRQHGDVRVFDLHCQPDEEALIGCLLREDVTFVGLSVCSDLFYEAARLARMAKTFAPATLVGIGGPHATFQSRDVLERFLEIDMTMLGAGELAASCLAANLAAGRPDRYAGVPNIAYRLPDHTVVFSETRPKRYIVRPARDLLPSLADYARRKKIEVPILSMDTSRGCHGACSFCMLQVDTQPRWRCRDLSDFREELLSETHTYPDRSIDLYLTDADILASARRLPLLLDAIRQAPAIRSLIASARADSVCRSSAYLEELFESGLSILELGIESASASQLERYGKQTEAQVNERALDLLLPLEQKYHAKISIDLIPFDPFVTLEELQDTDRFMKAYFYKKAGYEEGLFVKTTLYPSTPLHTQALAAGLILDDRGGQPSHWRFANADAATAYQKMSAFQQLIYPALRRSRKAASGLSTASLRDTMGVREYAEFLKQQRFLGEAPYRAFHQAVWKPEEPAGTFFERMREEVEQACRSLDRIVGTVNPVINPAV